MFYDTLAALFAFIGDARKVYLANDPLWDFTTNKTYNLYFYLPGKRLEISVSKDNAQDIKSILETAVFKENIIIICFNLKEVLSYLRFHTNKSVSIKSIVLDLKLIESFLGIQKKVPENYKEALHREQAVLGLPNWKLIYKSIFSPLMKDVIPSLENTPLINKKSQNMVYSHYEIDGQANGRSLCSKAFVNSYNPHILGEKEKSELKPVGYGKLFMYCDYKHMEVSILQWLSNDLYMGELLNSGKDFYKSLHNILFDRPCDTPEGRSLCKSIFLPIIYGQSISSLAEKLSIETNLAEHITIRLKNTFKTAFSWVESFEQSSIVEDYFGRKRDFSESPHKARNFCVQSPASIFCLEKLIVLWKALKDTEARIVFHVHDGYGLICSKNNFRDIFTIAQTTLSGYSELMKGLKIGIDTKIGANLNDMFPIEKIL